VLRLAIAAAVVVVVKKETVCVCVCVCVFVCELQKSFAMHKKSLKRKIIFCLEEIKQD
jgi:hypothetical protein